MSLSMCLNMRQSLELRGGACQTIFPVVERFIEADSDRMFALEHIASRKNMEKYRSWMDFLFAEVFTQYRNRCLRFYDGKDVQVVEWATKEQILEWQATLLRFVALAHVAHCEKRALSWSKARSMVLLAA